MVDLTVPQARALVALNFPSDSLRAIQGLVQTPARRTAQVLVEQARIANGARVVADVEVIQAAILVVVRGRVADPALRVWTFTLDGHDFFVVRLGDDATLLYDVSTEQWTEWDSKDSGAWRPNTGITWIGGQALAHTYGSSVVAGDDTFGLLWFLDPDQPYDDAPDAVRGTQEIEFERIVSGQVLATGRQNLSCFAVFVVGDNYGISATDFVPGVTLEYSDDQGRNFVTTEMLAVETDLDMETPYSWYSLGQITAPGRIFRVRDNGVFTRIDTMDMNDDGG